MRRVKKCNPAGGSIERIYAEPPANNEPCRTADGRSALPPLKEGEKRGWQGGTLYGCWGGGCAAGALGCVSQRRDCCASAGGQLFARRHGNSGAVHTLHEGPAVRTCAWNASSRRGRDREGNPVAESAAKAGSRRERNVQKKCKKSRMKCSGPSPIRFLLRSACASSR